MVEFVLVRFLDVEYNMVAVVKYFFDIWRPSLYVNFFFGIWAIHARRQLKRKNNFPSFQSVHFLFVLKLN